MTTVPDQAAIAARAAAARLTADYGPSLPLHVEAAIHDADNRPTRYTDPVAIGGLIVAAATLAWAIVNDLRKTTPNPAPAVVARTLRVQLDTRGLYSAQRDQIIEVVVEETIRTTTQVDPTTRP